MLFLVEIDHVKSGLMPSPEQSRAFIEQVIFPTLARAEQLTAEGKILAGGPVAGQIALRFMVQADSPQEADQIVTSLPLWPLSDTRVTPLIAFGDRRKHVRALLDGLQSAPPPPQQG
jgi:muconolactone delta-isomerase